MAVRVSKFPKPKKVNKSALKRKADTMFSKLVRSYGRCEARKLAPECKCGGVLQCAHLITRGNYRLRWDLNNAICLCAGHHRYFTQRPLDWVKFLQDNFKPRYDYVMLHKNEIVKTDYVKVLQILEGYHGRQK